jgi:nucleoside-diphosphate-sugar epimerase
MTVLVTGATGTVGSLVLTQLAERESVPLRALTRSLGPFTQLIRSFAPAWMARFQKEGLIATPAGLQHLTDRLGRPPRSYRDFAAELVHQWTAQP